MTKLNEDAIEKRAIELLEQQGYQYIPSAHIAPGGQAPQRESYEDAILFEQLQDALQRLNPDIPSHCRDDAVKQLRRLNSTDLTANNETFHRMLTEGVVVNVQENGRPRGKRVFLMDFNHPHNNHFCVVNQFTLSQNNATKRPDIILFINGLPLVVFELKNPTLQEDALNSAFRQLQTYKHIIPNLFTYNGFMVISDGFDARAGTISAGMSRFMAWKTSDGKTLASRRTIQLETLIQGMLAKETLLDLIRHFIVFEKSKKEDPQTRIITIQTVKKLAAYHQYYAVNRAVQSTLRAAGFGSPPGQTRAYGASLVMEPPGNYGLEDVESQPRGDRKGGVVWHTQGSGKSLSMVFYTGKIVLTLENPTILVITDRNDLDNQLFDTFAASKQLLRQEPVQADDRGHLKELLKVSSGGVVFTTIQKFLPQEGNVYETLSLRENIIVMADEAHRTQYGFKAKIVDEKDPTGAVIGQKVVYGFAKYMRDALPNATYLGFTGTPIENTDVNTPAVFGHYVDVYDIAQAVSDGATVPIYYESRLAKINFSPEGRELVRQLDEELEEELSDTQKAKAKWTQLEALIGSKDRIIRVARDMIFHFSQREEVLNGKGMIVAMSRRIAAELYGEIVRLNPHWHDDHLKKGVIKVVMTSDSADGPLIAQHHTTKEQRRLLADRMKDPGDELKLVIVCDMWLTGFDVPPLHTLYIDKPMKGHNLMQAIARVNRVYLDKPGGLVVDYLGIASDLKKALAFYSDSGGKGDAAVDQGKALDMLMEKLEVVTQMFYGFPLDDYFTGNTGNRLSLILAAEDHILGLEDGKRRFLNEVTALSHALSIANTHQQATHIRERVAFFVLIKKRLAKFGGDRYGRSSIEIETAIRQVIDKALVSEQVIDVFDAAGIKKPNISILSDEFLLEVKNMKHQHLALEVLKKLLNDEIRARTKKNLIQSTSLLEMLEDAINRYHGKIITAAEFMEELIQMSKSIGKMDREAREMGLTDNEYAFYTAIAANDSARQLMEKETLRLLATELFKSVKANASIDWTIKENVRAKLRLTVKGLLKKYGYPPDMQAEAIKTVLKQAERIADELTQCS